MVKLEKGNDFGSNVKWDTNAALLIFDWLCFVDIDEVTDLVVVLIIGALGTIRCLCVEAALKVSSGISRLCDTWLLLIIDRLLSFRVDVIVV